MLTIISYHTDHLYLANYLSEHIVINVLPGDRLSDILDSGDVTEEVLFQINLSNYSSFFSDTDYPHKVVFESGRRVLNYGATDISKTKVHEILESLDLPCLRVLKKELDDSDLVFVKSNLNYGGNHERNLSENMLSRLGVDYSFDSVPKSNEYKKYVAKNVPDSYWSHKGLIVEKFVENEKGSYVRIYKNNDNYAVVCAFMPGKDIKKMSMRAEREIIYFHSDSIELMENINYRNALIDSAKFFNDQNIDFGTIDILTDDCNTNYIIDFNDTPHWGAPEPRDFLNFLAS